MQSAAGLGDDVTILPLFRCLDVELVADTFVGRAMMPARALGTNIRTILAQLGRQFH